MELKDEIKQLEDDIKITSSMKEEKEAELADIDPESTDDADTNMIINLGIAVGRKPATMTAHLIVAPVGTMAVPKMAQKGMGKVGKLTGNETLTGVEDDERITMDDMPDALWDAFGNYLNMSLSKPMAMVAEVSDLIYVAVGFVFMVATGWYVDEMANTDAKEAYEPATNTVAVMGFMMVVTGTYAFLAVLDGSQSLRPVHLLAASVMQLPVTENCCFHPQLVMRGGMRSNYR